ncbi:hypothetical protein A2533_00060 [Candidatus Falkowbacteria bacterium RIFOXYD2_FULL_35_9]|uniref:GxxExxY protein n=1 Tax=Candidatus Falkowbacteria bacterium RIFOXYC2_FULL_36_12 TaxID=1798002 RepID=A0A1F5SYN7_9BACT|nr:MAG: hypothetical protein A2300_03255 [Candidatus Falkowbacteria bacterium RIFOXYB2_FULL_35_7]OGF31835.1 MAG: hypothetical protein A2478_05120 [Candidatus Falkowbacteria bacterium RIFOXYC2_FULL_36_12]OGF34642.1 MAG: hypothetical protein A2223_00650 [Candidatus Falkowbacteria bacterium RIFOXYA2_FULL_35_8]OGF45727.1 MAG: hypothetical protein A2533_00060 [Candidatus Falkowbacteria bacterium RIFOXYD2_FULL_35_9]
MKDKVLYKDLSYIVGGILFQVYNYHGFGLREKIYCQYINKLLRENKINFQEQFTIPVKYYNRHEVKRYADFLIDDQIILELKTGKRLFGKDFDQTFEYLKLTNKKLGLLVLFSPEKVIIHRVLNNQ